LGPDQLQALSLAAVMGLALGAPLAGPLGSRIEKRTMLILGKSGMFVCNAVPVTLKLLGLLPASGPTLTTFLATSAFLSGAAMGLSIIAFLSIVADAADEHEYLFYTRREGLYFAGWSFAAKSATGAGLLIAGVVLQLIDFPTNLAEHGATVLPEHTITWLGIAGGPGGALLSVVAIGIIFFYRLDKGTHAEILVELSARREGGRASIVP
jgi:GPH family glycoside/pentoside/hexuronide:cation symporter